MMTSLTRCSGEGPVLPAAGDPSLAPPLGQLSLEPSVVNPPPISSFPIDAQELSVVAHPRRHRPDYFPGIPAPKMSPTVPPTKDCPLLTDQLSITPDQCFLSLLPGKRSLCFPFCHPKLHLAFEALPPESFFWLPTPLRRAPDLSQTYAVDVCPFCCL